MVRHTLILVPPPLWLPRMWDDYAARLRAALRDGGVRAPVKTIGAPLFGYGVPFAQGLERANALRAAPGEIVLVRWCGVMLLEAVAVVLGEGVAPESVRAALANEMVLREHEGEHRPSDGRMYGYRHEPGASALIAKLVERVPRRVYIADFESVPREDDANTAARDVDVLRATALSNGTDSPTNLVLVFRPRGPRAEEETWELGRHGSADMSTLVLSEDDPLAELDPERLFGGRDLALLATPASSATVRPRVGLGRCHADDSIACLYGAPMVEDAALWFMV